MRLLLTLVLLLNPGTASAPPLRARIAVVDTGLDVTDPKIAPYVCETGSVDLTGTGLTDRHGHGTNVAYIIARGMDPKKQCLVVVKWYDTSERNDRHKVEYSDMAEAAIATGAKLVNMSYGGTTDSFLEDMAIRKGVASGITFVMAAGNTSQDLDQKCDFYPACSFYGVPEVHVVGALGRDGKRAWFSNYGRLISDWAAGDRVGAGGRTMSGTSQAAANVTADLARKARM